MKTSSGILLCVLALSACSPLVELEDENTALRAKIDSLEILLGEYRSQSDLLEERLSAVERENLQLDDRNRQLSARIAELQYGGAVDEQGGIARADGTREMTDVTPVPLSTQAAPIYKKETPPDLTFLRQYQSALSAYNAREYPRAARLFTDLLATADANDMIDNCVFWLGETYVQLGELEEAHVRFSTVLGYDGSDKTAAALVSRARTAIALGRSAEAREDLERCIRTFPRSEQAATARRLLKKLD